MPKPRKVDDPTLRRHFTPGKTPAVNCACRDIESTARFTVTVDGHTVCSWCGGDYALLEAT